MKVLIAADIFGLTPELAVQAEQVHAGASIVSPYPEPADFHDEDAAYTCFLGSGGIDAYTARVSDAIAAMRPDVLVGFSVGATAAWRALSAPGSGVRLGILFYGSRIRDYLYMRPAVPVKLTFAEQEKALQVAPLVSVLRTQGMDAVITPGTRHGYMNPRSPGFDPDAMQAGLQKVAGLLAASEIDVTGAGA